MKVIPTTDEKISEIAKELAQEFDTLGILDYAFPKTMFDALIETIATAICTGNSLLSYAAFCYAWEQLESYPMRSNFKFQGGRWQILLNWINQKTAEMKGEAENNDN